MVVHILHLSLNPHLTESQVVQDVIGTQEMLDSERDDNCGTVLLMGVSD